MKQPFWIVNETRIGHTGESAGFDLDQPIAPIEKSRDLGLCNGFRIWYWPPTEELMDRIVREAGFLQVDFWIGTSLHNHWIKVSGKTEQEFYDYYASMLKAAAKKYGDKFFWTVTGEPDSQAPNWPVERFKSKSEAHDFFMAWVKDFAPAMNTGTKLRWHDYLGTKDVDLKKHNVAIHLGYPMTAHYACELGVRLVWIECNCMLPEGVQVTVAFARGAANQFRANKTYWGLDFSTWNDPSALATSYDEKGRRLGGCTESLLVREWMYTFLSGANLLHQEVSDRTHWIWHPKPYARLSKLGKRAARFGKFAMSFDRGKPYRPVGVMLEHDHGWMSTLDEGGGNQVWCGTIPAGKADLTISHFFDMAFPGHAGGLTGYGELYAEKPWSTQAEFRQMVRAGKDMRPYEKGRLASSRWGDVIDVVLDNCPEDILADYKVLVILGGLKVRGGLAKKLERYVRQGGILITNVTHFFDCPEEQLESRVSHGTQGRPWSIPSTRDGKVAPGIERFLGFRFTGTKFAGNSSFCCRCEAALPEDGFLVEDVVLKEATPIAAIPRYLYPAAPDAPIEQSPLAVEHKVGRGKVIVTLPYFMMQPVSRGPLRIAEHIYDHVIRETLPFRINGPAVQHLYNRVAGGWLVSVFNNGPGTWKGELSAAAKPSATTFAWGRGGDLQWQRSGRGWTLALSIPKFDFRIVKVAERSSRGKSS